MAKGKANKERLAYTIAEIFKTVKLIVTAVYISNSKVITVQIERNRLQYKLEWLQRTSIAVWLSKNGCNGNCAPFGVWCGERKRGVLPRSVLMVRVAHC